jgi:hypothetical protein
MANRQPKKKMAAKAPLKAEKRQSIAPVKKTPKPHLAMDGTSHSEISIMRNEYYSKEIIDEAREAFDLDRLKAKISDGKATFLHEGQYQIYKMWHSIEALSVHNTMFVVLFLINIGKILNEVRSQLTRTEFVKWRRDVFPPKQERYLQQAQQLAEMGILAERYASMGKKRLLMLEKLRKDENKETFEALFDDHPVPEEVEETLPDEEEIKTRLFPDSTEDMNGDLLQEHVDAMITFNRLKAAGITFTTFDQAYLIAAYKRDAITIKRAKKLAAWLNSKGNLRQRKKWFDFYTMNKGVFPDSQSRSSSTRDSVNYMLGNFNDFCTKSDFSDQEWIEKQKILIDENILRQSYNWLKIVARKMDIRLTSR